MAFCGASTHQLGHSVDNMLKESITFMNVDLTFADRTNVYVKNKHRSRNNAFAQLHGCMDYIFYKHQISPLPNFTRDYLQSCAVTIKLNNISITIASIYCPPRHNISDSQFNDYFRSSNSQCCFNS